MSIAPSSGRCYFISMSIQKVLFLVFIVLQSGCASFSKAPIASSKVCARTPAKAYAEPPPPLVTVPGNLFYSDSDNSIIDESLYAQNEEARKPFRKYLDQIIKMSENTAEGDQDASLAVNKWLLKWAEGDALTKVDSQAGGFERKWILSGLLISYLSNKPYSGWEQQEKIESWLNKLTHLMMDDYQVYQKKSQRNNHVYWAGLVAIEMSLINNDSDLLKWGLEKIRYGLAQVDKEGVLPLELDRKGKALQYHRVSLDAFVMAAYLLKEKNINLLSEYDGALERLAEKTLQGFETPEIFAEKTGVKQEFNLSDSTTWASIYLQLKPDSSRAKNMLNKTPTSWNRSLGGRPVTLLENNKNRSVRCDGAIH